MVTTSFRRSWRDCFQARVSRSWPPVPHGGGAPVAGEVVLQAVDVGADHNEELVEVEAHGGEAVSGGRLGERRRDLVGTAEVVVARFDAAIDAVSHQAFLRNTHTCPW